MKINQIIKKYRVLHEQHVKSWDDSQKKIRSGIVGHAVESYNYMTRGNKLFEDFIKELSDQEVFPKKVKSQKQNTKQIPSQRKLQHGRKD